MSQSGSLQEPHEDRPKLGRLRLILLTSLALLLQLPFAIVLSTSEDVDTIARIARIGVAVASPLVFCFAHRRPGPRVAILAGLTAFDVLVWAASYSSVVYSVSDRMGIQPGPMNGPNSGPWNDGTGGPWMGGPGDLAQNFGGPEVTPFYAAFLFALVAAIVRGRWIWAAASAGGLWLGLLILGPILSVDWSVGRVVTATLGLVVAVSIGALWRHRLESRRTAEERARQRQADVAQSERIRIARELHDVLGHSLSQINVQAGVGEHLIDRDPEQARRALAAIKELSSSGLDEVRAVLRTMRSGPEGAAPLAPIRGLDDLPALIATMTGKPEVRLVDHRPKAAEIPAPQRLSRAADTAGYRIVQEALTNVVRHAEASTVTVEISRAGGFVQIKVDDDGRGLGRGRTGPSHARLGGDGDGHGEGSGILGMRERAEILGGSFMIDVSESGGTTVTVRLPWSITAVAETDSETGQE